MNGCPLCHNKNLKKKYRLKPEKLLKGIDYFRILKCRNCGIVFSSLLDNPDQVDSGYEQEYFEKYDTSFKNNPKIKTNIDTLNMLERLKPSKGRLLDFGCAEGNFLMLAKRKGWEVCGVDLSKFATEIAKKRGLEVYNKSIQDVKFKNESFDVITLWDTIEHLSDFEKMFKELKRILKKDGLLIIRTPNENSIFHLIAHLSHLLSFKMIKYFMKIIYHTDHFYYFSKKTLSNALNMNGFELKKIIMNDQTEMTYKNPILKLLIGIIRTIGILIGKQHALLAVAVKK